MKGGGGWEVVGWRMTMMITKYNHHKSTNKCEILARAPYR